MYIISAGEPPNPTPIHAASSISVGVKPFCLALYLPIRRRWSPGDVIQLKLEVVPQVIEANPRVADDTGRVAIQRGPLIYCLEEIDQPAGTSLSDAA